MKKLVAAIFMLTCISCSQKSEHHSNSDNTETMSSKQIIESKNAPAPIGPYSQAVLHDGTLYVSGQIAINPQTGELDTSSLAVETDLVLKNLGAVLSEAGMDYSNVLKCSIFLSDMNSFAEVNEIYGRYFSTNPPARETVAVKTLPKNVNVEISCIAAK